MARTTYKDGDDLIKLLIVIFDFIILNALLLAFTELAKGNVPNYIFENTRTVFLISNFALIIAQNEYSTIVHLRSTKFASSYIQTLKLTLSHCLIMFVSLRLLSEVGDLFNFMVAFTICEHVIFVMSRLAEHNLLKRYRRSGGNNINVVFVGNDIANSYIYNDLMDDMSTGYRVIGYFADGEIENCNSQFKHLGTLSDLNAQMEGCLNVSENDKKKMSSDLKAAESINDNNFQLSAVDEIFCSLSHGEHKEISKIIQFCDDNVIHFYYVPREFGNKKLSLKPTRIGNFRLYTNHAEPLLELRNYMLKRGFDILFSGLVCLCLLPFIPIIALIIKLQSPGPLFFKQERTGFNGETFYCLKFRSMHVNKDADSMQATKNDPRKYPFGNFMRKTNIDELPQFLNVLKGDMSIVGPRPHMLKHTEEYSELISAYMVRHFCKPGITGYAQVTGFRGETKEVWQMEERIKRDIWYIENWSFWLDMKIILLTAKSMIVPDKNAY